MWLVNAEACRRGESVRFRCADFGRRAKRDGVAASEVERIEGSGVMVKRESRGVVGTVDKGRREGWRRPVDRLKGQNENG